jgi:di/tricarboxylate transporter
MTLTQALAFTIILVMMVLFAWGRWRYDLVAAVALMAAVVVGIVPPEQAFKGFSDDIVIIVGSALVVSAAVARSGVIERVARWLGPYLVDINRQIIALVGSVTLLSAFVKNVGALAMLMPIAFQFARRSGTSPSLVAS